MKRKVESSLKGKDAYSKKYATIDKTLQGAEDCEEVPRPISTILYNPPKKSVPSYIN